MNFSDNLPSIHPIENIKTLDVMGGTSHFCGGLCLSVPIEKAGPLTSVVHQGNFKANDVVIPEGVEFWAINGGILPHPAEAIFQQARTATFMGQKIISTFAPKALENQWGEKHLTILSADVWRSIRDLIPESISGTQFLETYGPLEANQGTVESATEYKVRLATEHPIYENERVQKFVRFLELAASNPAARHHFLTAAGELMVQSHFSYDHRYNLGNFCSELLVKLARQAGKESGIYGAKLSGDGDSTTIALLCDRQKNPDFETTLHSIAAAYKAETGNKTHIFQGNNR